MQPAIMTWLTPLPPIMSFFLIVLFAHRSNRASHTIAVGAMLISWTLAMAVFFRAVGTTHLAENPFTSSIAWIPTGTTALHIGVLIDPLGAVSLFFVAWTCLAIFVYSIGYHNFGHARDKDDVPGLPPKAGGIDPMYARFFAFISLFAFGMLTLVVSDNLLTLFIGWEIMGLCSYLLIGFWYAKESARKAMVKAFMTTRVGDVFMLLGLAYLYSSTGTLSYRVIFSEPVLSRLAGTPSVIAGLSVAGMIGLLLFFGTVGKSAQWPLHVWLPDAMEGPTPVSAMIHAATMVSAGVYLILRFFPLITAGWHEGQPLNPTMTVIAGVGAFTALFAATIAVTQNDIKRVLAYSTISQLGYMVAAVGIGAFVAGAFHLITHAFFKALLFLGSGSVIHGIEHGAHESHEHVADANDMMIMGGLRRKMPITFWTFVAGGLALSGFPLITAGFWSKDEILGHAFQTGQAWVFGALVLAALLTAFYTARQITLTFLGEPRSAAAEHAPESVPTMTIPLIVLAVFAVGAGWLGIGEDFPVIGGLIPNWFHAFVGSTLLAEPAATHFNAVPVLSSMVVAVGGLLIGWLVYRRMRRGAADPLVKPLGVVYTTVQRKYYFDELYVFLLVRPAYWFAETFTYRWIDRGVIDGILHAIARFALRLGSFLRNAIDLPIINGSGNMVGEGVKRGGRGLRWIQTGRVQFYLVVGLLFAGIVLSYTLAARP
jgi:NADH-quinone oxidoreductase subunit L